MVYSILRSCYWPFKNLKSISKMGNYGHSPWKLICYLSKYLSFRTSVLRCSLISSWESVPGFWDFWEIFIFEVSYQYSISWGKLHFKSFCLVCPDAMSGHVQICPNWILEVTCLERAGPQTWQKWNFEVLKIWSRLWTKIIDFNWKRHNQFDNFYSWWTPRIGCHSLCTQLWRK